MGRERNRRSGAALSAGVVAIVLFSLSPSHGTAPFSRCPYARPNTDGLIGVLGHSDPCSSKSKRYTTAAEAAAAAGFAIPDCFDHAYFFVGRQPIEGVAEEFYLGDLALYANRSTYEGPLLRPSPVVSPIETSVHGVPAEAFQNDIPGGRLRIGNSMYATLFRSQVSWRENGVVYSLMSVASWPVKRLIGLANDCVMISPPPLPLFPTNTSFPVRQLTTIDWNRPLEYSTLIDPQDAKASLHNAFTPNVRSLRKVFAGPIGSARRASHILVFVLDVPRIGRAVVYEYPAQQAQQEFNESIRTIARTRSNVPTTGYYEVTSVRGGRPALLTVSGGGTGTTVEWLENGIDVTLALKSLSADQALALAERI